MLLALVLLCGLIPAVAPTAEAAGWAQGYLDTLSGWGVMRGDIQNGLDPDRDITRAEFVAIMNRAYGYKDMKGTPFTDVPVSAWYADDIDIAYTVGYFNGTSATTASPNATLTREQAAVLLARNLMLQPTVGESLGFSDSRELSSWSRGLIGAAAEIGVINGYSDGSFRPNGRITRGEVAAMVARSLGTLIKDSGDHSLSSVYGNVTINQPGVNLRNTVIVGNLYLTGGIGLGDVLLENVTVYGQIIVAGAGESNASRSSVILRNVVANKLVVDNISNQFVTVRAEGDTDIAQTSIRTNAYVEDTTPDGYGLKLIEIDGENGIRVQLAGNIKEAVNLTPESSLQIVQGVAKKVTIDEKATNSTVNIYSGARIDELNLDVSTSVSGEGDIGHLQIGAPDCSVSMLPDEITIRPGLDATIGGIIMDSNTASESSADPRLLAGYPVARNIAPTSGTLVASTNKAGTVYWAITALADGSVDEDTVITPPTYGGNIVQSGTINAARSKTEYTAALNKLTTDGSYYITSILVDSRGNRSPLKVTAFSTPDDTVPAFTTGYPVMTKTRTDRSQVTVMVNKNCQMYYALLPGGSTMPSTQELKAGAVRGNLGYGVVDVVKNVTQPTNINNVTLDEQTSYDLYLWLNDYDGAKSSTVRKLTFTTPDETPPVITEMMQTNSQASSVQMTYAINEPGTLYWAVVPEGEDYESAFMNYALDSTEAKVKMESGVGSLQHGSSNAARADTEVRFNISNLITANTNTTSYTLFYLAKDRTGNYGEKVEKINIRTLDTDAPTVTQEFTRYNEDKENEPLADTDIRLVFSESVQGGSKGEQVFLTLYEKVTRAVQADAKKAAREDLAKALREHITMYYVPATGRPVEVKVRDKDNYNDVKKTGDWVIDYRYARVSMEAGKMVITFPTNDDTDTNENGSALKLGSGAEYYFHVEGIFDNAISPNQMPSQDLPRFRTLFAQVALSIGDTWVIESAVDKNNQSITFVDNKDNQQNRVDVIFRADPISVDRVDENMRYDLLLWTDTNMTFTLYRRTVNSTGPWEQLGQKKIEVAGADQDGYVYMSLTKEFLDPVQAPSFEKLRDQDGKAYEYAIHVDKIGDSDNFTSWNHDLRMRVSAVAGTQYNLISLATGSFLHQYEEALNDGVASIGSPDPFNIRKPFTDSRPPEFVPGSPTASIEDISATINVMLDRPGRVYYIVFPLSQLKDENGNTISNVDAPLGEDVIDKIKSYTAATTVRLARDGEKDWPKVSRIPNIEQTSEELNISAPTTNAVHSGTFTPDVIKGNTPNVAANVASRIELKDLSPNTIYYMCMVTSATSATYSEQPIIYRFTTKEAIRPVIDLSATGSNVNVTVDRTTALDYFLAINGREGDDFQERFSGYAKDWIQNGVGGSGWTVNTTTGECSNGTYRFTFTQKKKEDGKTIDVAGMTVVDAMATRCLKGNTYVGSVFDIFATDTAKSHFAGLIRSSSSTNAQIVMSGSGTFTEAGNNRPANQVKCTGMTPGIYYTFLSVGKSSEGSGDSFRAYYSVRQSDSEAPMVNSAPLTVEKWEMNTAGRPTGKLTSGQIVLGFSEPLWAVSSGSGSTQIAYRIDRCSSQADPAHLLNHGSIALGSMIATTSAGVSVQMDSTHNGATAGIETITLDLTNIEYGKTYSVNFKSGICDQSNNGIGTRSALRVGIRVVRTETGDETNPYAYDIEVSINNGWDAR